MNLKKLTILYSTVGLLLTSVAKAGKFHLRQDDTDEDGYDTLLE